MLLHWQDALEAPSPFARPVPLDADLEAAIEWTCGRTAQQAKDEREALIAQIEEVGKQYRNAGLCEEWLSRADPQTRKICSTVNGPLLEMLAQSIGYRDASCIDLLRNGAPIIGRLPRFGGAGALLEDAQDVDTGAFWRDAIGNSNENEITYLERA